MSGVCTRARRETVAPTRAGARADIPARRLAGDAFEAMIENAIVRPEDLYELDGDTLLRRRNGCVETFDADLAVIDFPYPW